MKIKELKLGKKLLLIIAIIITGCGTSILEKKKITNNAINYFSNKYNINKKIYMMME